MEQEMFAVLNRQRQENEQRELLACNDSTVQFGLTLTAEDAAELTAARNETLKKYERVEFGRGMLDRLVLTFCDSEYISQDEYPDTLAALQEIFYKFKNASNDMLTDTELLNFMKEQFEEVCRGDLDYLADTCLERFTRAVRAGYRGYESSDGLGDYEQFSEEQRWDKELYLQVLHDLCWS